ncbi:hypothetical protein [Zavarzinella formosa]|uniref:hypothetical protein n=1 Tax=Zavarzinella formosa TaxID=360055 RepID=UPI0002F47DAA|nr:hypothetical protein [Zavarzinella formosa]
MAFNPNEVTPCGQTFAQIDARQAEYVLNANAEKAWEFVLEDVSVGFKAGGGVATCWSTAA